MILNSIEQGEGPPILLLHGLFGAAKNLGVIARALSAQARVVSLDARNHGDSPHDPAMTYETMAADVAETAASLNITQASIIGHSMGGKTAMMLALTSPALVSRLAVLDIAPVPYGHDFDAYVAGMRALPVTPNLTRAAADEALAAFVPEAPFRAFLLNNLHVGPQPRWRINLDNIASAMPDLIAWSPPAAAKPYPGPSAFIRGANSTYVSKDGQAAIKSWFPNASLETIDHAGHWLHAEQPDKVVAALQGFLAA
jgi:pimeloyl-ACP methyl ester carboxylesterase